MVHFRGYAPRVERLTAMSRALAHRGPDGSGEFVDGPVALAHRRRAVHGTRSHQPVVAEDYVVLLDGWVYDHE